jgi:hypothetical protein
VPTWGRRRPLHKTTSSPLPPLTLAHALHTHAPHTNPRTHSLPPTFTHIRTHAPTNTCSNYKTYPWMEALARTATGLSSPRVEFADSAFTRQWNRSNLVCFKRVVATGTTGYVVGDGSSVYS